MAPARVAAGASSHTLAQEVSPDQDTGSSLPDGDAAPSASLAETSDPSYGSKAASQPPTARDDANETAEERRERRAAEPQAQRQADARQNGRPSGGQSARAAERRRGTQELPSLPTLRRIEPGTSMARPTLLREGLSGDLLRPLLDGLDPLSGGHLWTSDATFTIGPRRSIGTDAGATSLAQEDVARALFRLIEESGLRVMTFDADVPYDLIFHPEGASIFDPGHDQPRIQVRAILAPAAAPDIAPLPLPACFSSRR